MTLEHNCHSQVPYAISQGFSLVRDRSPLLLNSVEKPENVLSNIQKLESIMYCKLNTIYSNSRLWPWYCLDPEDAITQVEEEVKEFCCARKNLFDEKGN